MCLGIPGQVVDIVDPDKRLGHVEVGGVRRLTNLLCIADDFPNLDGLVGEWVLVHVGFAMSRIDPDEAARTLALMAELGALHQPHDEGRSAGEPDSAEERR